MQPSLALTYGDRMVYHRRERALIGLLMRGLRGARRGLVVASALTLASGLVLIGGSAAFAGSGIATTTTLSTSANPSVLDAKVTLVATITASFYASSVPTGSVTFTDGGSDLGTASVGVVLEGGNTAVVEAQLKTSSLPLGTSSIVATYSGDTSYQGSTSAAYSQDVQEATSVVLTASPTSSVVGSPVSLTAVVSPASGGLVSGGEVLFTSGGEPLAQLPVQTTTVDGTRVSEAVDSVSGLPIGSDKIVAQFLGTPDYRGSSGSTVETVNPQPSVLPSPPRDLMATATKGGVMLGWLPPASEGSSPVEAYAVFEGTTSGGESATPINPEPLGAGANSYTVSDLNPGETYYFTVVAISAVGPSSASNEVSAVPLALETAPAPPSDVVATGGSGQVELRWSAPSTDGGSPVLGYDVFEGTTSGGESATPVNASLLGSGVTSFTVTGLKPGGTYYFTVVAVNAAGRSLASTEVSATISSVAQSLTAPSPSTRSSTQPQASTSTTTNPEAVTLRTGPPRPPSSHTWLLLPGAMLVALGALGLVGSEVRARRRRSV